MHIVSVDQLVLLSRGELADVILDPQNIPHIRHIASLLWRFADCEGDCNCPEETKTIILNTSQPPPIHPS